MIDKNVGINVSAYFHGKMSDITFILLEKNIQVSSHIVSLENCFDALNKLKKIAGSIYA